MDPVTSSPPIAQHVRALERANEVRLARADLKRRIAEGQLGAADVILTSPWEAESMAVADVLMSQRRWGRTRVRRLLAPLEIPETQALGLMTTGQRHAVAHALRADGETGDVLATVRGITGVVGKLEDWVALERAGRRCEELSEHLQEAVTQRDDHVRRLSREGASRRAVAAAARITPGRVQQIVSAPEGPSVARPADPAPQTGFDAVSARASAATT